jgi:ribosomal protein S18 acetylase RimI-like enzyme
MQIRDARMEDADELARITLEARRAILTGLVPEAVIAGFTREESVRNWRRTLRELAAHIDPDQFLFIAQTTEGLPVGLVMGGPAHEQDPMYRGEVYVLSVDDAHRRQGYGRLLVAYAAGRLAQTGLRPFLIRVLRENTPARRFYEALGGELLSGSREINEDGILLDEVAYGWRSGPRAASPAT